MRTHYQEGDYHPPRHTSKKDTRKWCKGRAGVKHDTRWRMDQRSAWGGSRCHHRVCVKCGKQAWDIFYITCIETRFDLERVIRRMNGQMW